MDYIEYRAKMEKQLKRIEDSVGAIRQTIECDGNSLLDNPASLLDISDEADDIATYAIVVRTCMMERLKDRFPLWLKQNRR